jgi:hypothetical protein
MIPEATRESVVEAMTRFDQELRDTPGWKHWEERESFKYAIDFEGRHYPVKTIVSTATNTPVASFSAGEEANTFIVKLGFQVVELPDSEPNQLSLQQLLEEILSRYLGARSTNDFGRNRPIWRAFTRVESAIANLSALRNRPTLRVEWSAGKGEFARVPWIAIIDSREVEAPRGGIYCVFLFREDMSGVYVTMNQGVTIPKRELGPSEARRTLANRSLRIRALVSDLRDRSFTLDEHIDLRSAGLGAEYENSTIAYKLYEINQVPPDSELEQDLDALLIAYSKALPPLARPVSTWIFQANRKLYDISGALGSLSKMTWLVSSYQDRILPGDKIFLWKSGADAGIVAEASIVTAPSMIEATEEELQFALEKQKFEGHQLRVELHIDAVVAPPLQRNILKADPRLADLSIIKSSQGTNFLVTPEQAAIIRELLKAERGDEDETPGAGEVVAPEPISRVWAYAPGPKAKFWEEFYREEIMAIGWDDLGDLSQYPDHDSMATKLIEVYKLAVYPINDSRACYDFVYTIKPGDRIIAKRGKDEIVGYGIVTGDYEFRFDRSTYRNIRRVRWERRGNWKSDPVFAAKTLTDWTRFPDTIESLMNLIGVSEASTTAPSHALPPYTIADALRGVAFEKDQFQEILDTWQRKKNLILQGPPGVGKTFLARKLAYALLGHDLPSHVEMVQFHQSYSYEDFVQGYRPSETGFARKEGIFVRFCKRASLDQNSAYVFIITRSTAVT